MSVTCEASSKSVSAEQHVLFLLDRCVNYLYGIQHILTTSKQGSAANASLSATLHNHQNQYWCEMWQLDQNANLGDTVTLILPAAKPGIPVVSRKKNRNQTKFSVTLRMCIIWLFIGGTSMGPAHCDCNRVLSSNVSTSTWVSSCILLSKSHQKNFRPVA